MIVYARRVCSHSEINYVGTRVETYGHPDSVRVCLWIAQRHTTRALHQGWYTLTLSAQPETQPFHLACAHTLPPLFREGKFRSWDAHRSARRSSACLLKLRVFPRPI